MPIPAQFTLDGRNSFFERILRDFIDLLKIWNNSHPVQTSTILAVWELEEN